PPRWLHLHSVHGPVLGGRGLQHHLRALRVRLLALYAPEDVAGRNYRRCVLRRLRFGDLADRPRRVAGHPARRLRWPGRAAAGRRQCGRATRLDHRVPVGDGAEPGGLLLRPARPLCDHRHLPSRRCLPRMGLARPDCVFRRLRGRDPVHGAAADRRPLLHRLLPQPPDQRRGLLLAGRPGRFRPGVPAVVPLAQRGRGAIRHRRQRARTPRHRRCGRGGRDVTEPVPRIITGETVGPVDATLAPRYSGEATFARLPRIDDVTHADAAVLGVPFDGGVSYRPGARFGPAHIRESSRLLRPYNPALQASPFASQQVADAGDLAVNPYSIEEAIGGIEQAARALLERAPFILTLGGDHTVALPMIRAVSAVHGPLAVVHFDAHLDTWDSYFGAAYTHGTPFRRASEEGLLDRSGCLHIGIRGPLYTDTDLTQDSELGFQ